MFELNLIKDKAKARQRRRVIFLSILSILFLAGLVSIFVGSLYWAETTTLQKKRHEVALITESNNNERNRLDVAQPRANKRLNSLILAYTESADVRRKYKRFTPALDDLYRQLPSGTEYWYTSIEIYPVKPVGGTADPATALLDKRTLDGEGYVQIIGSDVLTQNALQRVSDRMRGIFDLAGQATLTAQPEASVASQGENAADETRYVRFNIQAQQTVFAGGGG